MANRIFVPNTRSDAIVGTESGQIEHNRPKSGSQTKEQVTQSIKSWADPPENCLRPVRRFNVPLHLARVPGGQGSSPAPNECRCCEVRQAHRRALLLRQ